MRLMDILWFLSTKYTMEKRYEGKNIFVLEFRFITLRND